MSSVFAEPYAMTFIDFQISPVSDFIGKNRQVLELLPFMSVELKFSVALKVLCEGTLVKREFPAVSYSRRQEAR